MPVGGSAIPLLTWKDFAETNSPRSPGWTTFWTVKPGTPSPGTTWSKWFGLATVSRKSRPGDEEETGILDEITGGRDDITAEIQETARPRLAELGIELMDFRFKRINYVPEVQRDVFARMIAERQRIAERYLSEGQGEAARIGGEKERELQRITSEAYRTAQETRGVADAEATRIYADAYNRDAAFYAFMKSMETVEQAIDPNTLLIMTTRGELFRYLNQPN